MSLLGSIIFLAGIIWLVFHYWEELAPREEKRQARRWLIEWAIKGLGAPLLIYFICIQGTAPILPPLVPRVAMGLAGGWFGQMIALTAPAMIISGSYWAALTFGWLVPMVIAHTERRRDLVAAGIVWGILCSPLIWASIRHGGWESAGLAGLLLFVPIVHYGSSMTEEEKPAAPFYTRAIVKMKMGKYSEAEEEVIQELEKCEDDFEGWMMLADLYANHFHDVSEAARTVREIVNQPNTTPTQISVAFHRLADWYMKLREDPDCAREALEEICKRLPGTHLAHMARLAIKQLPTSAEQMVERRNGRVIRMPALNESLHAPAHTEVTALSKGEASLEAKRYKDKLTKEPGDIVTREKLARMLAEQLEQPEAAIQQIDLLLAMPNQPEEKMAEWIALAASWQLARKDWDAARASLERLIREYPQSPQAFAAQRRLSLMNMDLKMRGRVARSP
ncbi:MAG: hypothetical protein JWR19_2477 [Pedosphaera sp.]|nr:hypothetical protein [Pedosphaera sp.]